MQDMPHDDFTSLMNITVASINNSEEKIMCRLPVAKVREHNYRIRRQSIHKTNADNTDNADNADNAQRSPNEMNSGGSWHHKETQNLFYSDHNYHNDDYHCNNKLLLQSSEDPLISHGANCLLTTTEYEDNKSLRMELQEKSLPGQGNPFDQQTLSMEDCGIMKMRAGCSHSTKQQLKAKANLMSAQNREKLHQQQQQHPRQHYESNNGITQNINGPINGASSRQRLVQGKKRSMASGSIKLRFHHQALPPEYLSHYEATQGHFRSAQQNSQATPSDNSKGKYQRQQQRVEQQHLAPRVSYGRNSHENVRSWLQKIAEIHRNATANQLASVKNKISSNLSGDDATHSVPALNNDEIERETEIKCETETETGVQSKHPAIVVEGPRRSLEGEAKAAELFPDCFVDLPYMGEITLEQSKPRRGRKPKKADICHLIYKNYGTAILPQRAAQAKFTESNESPSHHQAKVTTLGPLMERMDTMRGGKELEEQPLNLCLRDHNIETLSLTSADDDDDDDDDDITETNSSCPTPITTPSDIFRDSMLAANMNQALARGNSNEDDFRMGRSSLSAYYQNILRNSSLLKQFHDGHFETIQKDNQLALKIPLPSGLLLSQIKSKSSQATATQILSPSTPNHCLIERTPTPSSVKSELSLDTATSMANSTIQAAANSTANSTQTPKRKRSAIYIPPLPSDTSMTSPANEVSICKFKFIGGAHPTLKEKKMLSVDADGNYRYFSGTGDKATRGYEYFPRECLQQAGGVLSNESGSGEKPNTEATAPMLLESRLQATNHSKRPLGNSLRQWPMPGHCVSNRPNDQQVEAATANERNPFSSSSSSSILKDTLAANMERVNKKSSTAQQYQVKRSTQREKLEKTFKEQGFLIQTQQLESAQGATYCKFRQLKKFSRYLFRNWKDYLPEELKHQQHQQHERNEQFDKRLLSLFPSSNILSTTLNVSASNPIENSSNTEMMPHDLQSSTNFAKTELGSLLTKT